MINSTIEKSFANLSEHSDDYLIVFVKDGQIFQRYKSKVSAFGMACLVMQDIQKEWAESRDSKT